MKGKTISGGDPDELHRGLTYVGCLERLAREAEAYGGEMILPTEGEDEHPLHFAVRLVESYQEDCDLHYRRRHLPLDAWPMWGRVLRNSRCGRLNMTRRFSRERFQDYGEADPKAAKRAARELAVWAKNERNKQ